MRHRQPNPPADGAFADSGAGGAARAVEGNGKTEAEMKKAGKAGFFHAGKEELLLHFFGSSLGGVSSGVDSFAGGLGSFASSVGRCVGGDGSRISSGVSRSGGSVSSRSSSVSSRSGSVGSRGSDIGSRSSSFRSGGFFRLGASCERGGEQGGEEEGMFHYGFLGCWQQREFGTSTPDRASDLDQPKILARGMSCK
jgi:hypothetical protein